MGPGTCGSAISSETTAHTSLSTGHTPLQILCWPHSYMLVLSANQSTSVHRQILHSCFVQVAFAGRASPVIPAAVRSKTWVTNRRLPPVLSHMPTQDRSLGLPIPQLSQPRMTLLSSSRQRNSLSFLVMHHTLEPTPGMSGQPKRGHQHGVDDRR